MENNKNMWLIQRETVSLRKINRIEIWQKEKLDFTTCF